MNFLVSHITRKPPIKVSACWNIEKGSFPPRTWVKCDHVSCSLVPRWLPGGLSVALAVLRHSLMMTPIFTSGTNASTSSSKSMATCPCCIRSSVLTQSSSRPGYHMTRLNVSNSSKQKTRLWMSGTGLWTRQKDQWTGGRLPLSVYTGIQVLQNCMAQDSVEWDSFDSLIQKKIKDFL